MINKTMAELLKEAVNDPMEDLAVFPQRKESGDLVSDGQLLADALKPMQQPDNIGSVISDTPHQTELPTQGTNFGTESNPPKPIPEITTSSDDLNIGRDCLLAIAVVEQHPEFVALSMHLKKYPEDHCILRYVYTDKNQDAITVLAEFCHAFNNKVDVLFPQDQGVVMDVTTARTLTFLALFDAETKRETDTLGLFEVLNQLYRNVDDADKDQIQLNLAIAGEYFYRYLQNQYPVSEMLNNTSIPGDLQDDQRRQFTILLAFMVFGNPYVATKLIDQPNTDESKIVLHNLLGNDPLPSTDLVAYIKNPTGESDVVEQWAKYFSTLARLIQNRHGIN